MARPEVRDRGAGEGDERSRLTSALLPRRARRTRSPDALLPTLYLRGVPAGDVQEAPSGLLGKDAPNLSPSVIGRLTGERQAEQERWQARDPSARPHVYPWADDVHLQACMEDQAACMLVLIGSTPEGGKELAGFQPGVRGSAQSWRELLTDRERRGLSAGPKIAVRDGAPGFWKALDEVLHGTRHQRCWLRCSLLPAYERTSVTGASFPPGRRGTAAAQRYSTFPSTLIA